MVRTYAVKGRKRKKTERYNREEEQEEEIQEEQPEDTEDTEEAVGKEGDSFELEGIPLAPSERKADKQPGVIFILERAALEVAKVGKVIHIL